MGKSSECMLMLERSAEANEAVDDALGTSAREAPFEDNATGVK